MPEGRENRAREKGEGAAQPRRSLRHLQILKISPNFFVKSPQKWKIRRIEKGANKRSFSVAFVLGKSRLGRPDLIGTKEKRKNFKEQS